MFFLVMLITFLPRCLTFRQLENILILLENLQRLLLVGLRVLGLRAWSLCPLERRAVCRDKVFPQIPFVLHHLQVKVKVILGGWKSSPSHTWCRQRPEIGCGHWRCVVSSWSCLRKSSSSTRKPSAAYIATCSLGGLPEDSSCLVHRLPRQGFHRRPRGLDTNLGSSPVVGLEWDRESEPETGIIWVFYLSDQNPFAPYRASSVLLKCHRC